MYNQNDYRIQYEDLLQYFEQVEIKDNKVYIKGKQTNMYPNNRFVLLCYLADKYGNYNFVDIVNAPLEQDLFTEDDLTIMLQHKVAIDSYSYETNTNFEHNERLITFNGSTLTPEEYMNYLSDYNLPDNYKPTSVYLHGVQTYQQYLDAVDSLAESVGEGVSLEYFNLEEEEKYHLEKKEQQLREMIGDSPHLMLVDDEEFMGIKTVEQAINYLENKHEHNLVYFGSNMFFSQLQIGTLAYAKKYFNLEIITNNSTLENAVEHAIKVLSNKYGNLAQGKIPSEKLEQYYLLFTYTVPYLVDNVRLRDKSLFEGLPLEEVRKYIKNGKLDLSYMSTHFKVQTKHSPTECEPLEKYFNLDPQQGIPADNPTGHDYQKTLDVEREIEAHIAILEKAITNFETAIDLTQLMLLDVEGTMYIGRYTPNYEIVGDLIDLVNAHKVEGQVVATHKYNRLVRLQDISNKEEMYEALKNVLVDTAIQAIRLASTDTQEESQPDYTRLMRFNSGGIIPYKVNDLTFPLMEQNLIRKRRNTAEVQQIVLSQINLANVRNKQLGVITIYGGVNISKLDYDMVSFLSIKEL